MVDKIIGLTTGQHPFHIRIMKENNAEIHHMGKFPGRLINELLHLPAGDIYITESNFYAPIIIRKLLQGKKKTVVINIAASPSIFLNKNPIIKWLMNMIDINLVEGEFGVEMIRKAGYKGETQIIYPTFEKNVLIMSNGERVKEKLVTKPFQILCMARYSWKIKGLDILQEAIKDIDCEVYVAGESSFIPSSGKFRMLGFTRKQDMEDLLNRCNLYIQASRFDTFSISVLEASYNGLPVIVS
jgi:glycosyltransferase involved in cell wall biosynthesis